MSVCGLVGDSQMEVSAIRTGMSLRLNRPLDLRRNSWVRRRASELASSERPMVCRANESCFRCGRSSSGGVGRSSASRVAACVSATVGLSGCCSSVFWGSSLRGSDSRVCGDVVGCYASTKAAWSKPVSVKERRYWCCSEADLGNGDPEEAQCQMLSDEAAGNRPLPMLSVKGERLHAWANWSQEKDAR